MFMHCHQSLSNGSLPLKHAVGFNLWPKLLVCLILNVHLFKIYSSLLTSFVIIGNNPLLCLVGKE